jgi:hypothetical protein
MADTGKVNIHGKEYETVASRVQRFREKHGDEYGIQTEIVSLSDDAVVMKANIYKLGTGGLVGHLVATGHAEEKRAASQINRTSALENAETSAIGRALAAFGMAGTEYASADEVATAITQQRAPQARTAAVEDELATPTQRAQIKAFMTALHVAEEDIPDVLVSDYGVKGKLTKAEAVRVLKELQ